MPEQKKLFRKVALERLSSPEQLDQVLQITPPKAWTALAGLAIIIAAALVWGFLGSVPVKVQGTGIFVNDRGVKTITSPVSGQISHMYIQSGQTLSQGQMVARIDQPELVEQISETRSKISDLEKEYQELLSYQAEQLRLETAHMKQEEKRISSEMAMIKEKLEWLEQRKEDQAELLENGLITRQKYLSTLEEMDASRQKIETLQNQKAELPIELRQTREGFENRSRNKQFEINETRRNLQQLNQRLRNRGRVFSSYTGRVVEVNAAEGDVVTTGSSLGILELTGEAVDEIQVAAFLPAATGKRVMPGMDVLITPTTVQAEEHGVMLGLVSEASAYPATMASIMNVLGNELLARELSARSSPLEVFISPIPSASSYSGFKWSSGQGPRVKIRTGTLAMVDVIVDEQRPVDLVLPWLKKHVLGIGQENN